MTAAELAAVAVQVAPFVAIIAVEVLGQGFDWRVESTLRQYEEELAAPPPTREEFIDFACHSFDHENAVQHLDLAIISLLILFISRLVGVITGESAPLVGALFIVTALFLFGVRWWVDGYFERRPPEKYYVKDVLFGVRYGPLLVVASNLVVVGVIVFIELTILTG